MTTQTGHRRKQEQAILALLSKPTIEAAANECGVSGRTLLRWLREPEFSASYRQAKSDLLTAATGRLRAAAGRAVGVLESVAVNRKAPAGARVTASRAILELAMRSHELDDLEARITRLEENGGTQV
jgi:hypothetical protein